MPGFYITNGVPISELQKYKNRIVNDINVDKFHLKRSTINKFFDDKCFSANDDYAVIQEGVLLNKKAMFKQYGADNIFELIIHMYENCGENFFSQFRGSFSGAVYDRQQGKWVIFTNHVGDNALFYYFVDGMFIAASQFSDVLETLRMNGIMPKINGDAIRDMLTYAFMSNEHTYAKDVSRLRGGCYIVFQNNALEVKTYYGMKQKLQDLSNYSEDDIIDELDKKFRDAVRLEYEKDIEYGYKHLNQLSGGLDSRMNIWVARDMGYHDMTCITFAQSESIDERIAQQIGKALDVDNIFWPLDSARHLLHIDEYVSMNYGTALYSGVGAMKEIL